MKQSRFPAILFILLAVIAAIVFLLTAGCFLLQAPACAPLLEYYIYLGSGSIHLFLLSVALLFLWKKDLRTTLNGLGINMDIERHVVFTAIGLAALFTLMFWLQLFSLAVGFNDQQKVTDKVTDLPLLVLALAVVIAPFTEELLFRAMLVDRLHSLFSSFSFGFSASSLLSIFCSSLLFGILHFSYGSVVEIVGVFVIGMLLAAIYRISRSVVPCIAIHLIYNLLSIAAMKMMAP